MTAHFPQRKTLPHNIPSWVTDGAVFFITISCRDRNVNQLCRQTVAESIWASVVFNAERSQWWPHLFLLMPDHLHGLFSFPNNVEMKRVIAAWKHYTAYKFGIHWQRDFFDHRLRGGESYREKAWYIRHNPVRAGLVKTAEDWPYAWSMK